MIDAQAESDADEVTHDGTAALGRIISKPTS